MGMRIRLVDPLSLVCDRPLGSWRKKRARRDQVFLHGSSIIRVSILGDDRVIHESLADGANKGVWYAHRRWISDSSRSPRKDIMAFYCCGLPFLRVYFLLMRALSSAEMNEVNESGIDDTTFLRWLRMAMVPDDPCGWTYLSQ
mmetsp:Transcript_40364/g.54930  ORF Transcript_40364/g.54930 Transcript_40364/m.54930 type:complete len:143 (-) Transcript_40364:506-934(-)|eukprot:CAMPEP_0185752644 /NCGR_PEP_ID=MMETSP1174-20130828/11431_1 /TAXON_ID=35687 /ORGANISM="Dictyocha speculum, Strain CCMP1381" /LENGTH=142 /DNA_ID=CAMNT_0028430181 /DNA_START=447 /DNA_END=875 /DNA_ORIENTATION=-